MKLSKSAHFVLSTHVEKYSIIITSEALMCPFQPPYSERVTAILTSNIINMILNFNE